jgi:uncharacterized protein YlxW (UPF0749 family)
MMNKLNSNLRQLILALILFFFGLLITLTIKKVDEPLPLTNARENELVQVLTDLNRQNEQLTQEINDQEGLLRSLQSGSTQDANQAAINRANALGVLAGTRTVAGPGINISLQGDRLAVNAFTLLDAVQELRDAGSLAIQINSVRVVANTWFVDTVGGVSVSGKVLNPPIVIRVIGDPQTLETAMLIPGGCSQTVIANGGEIEIQKNNNIEIDAILTPIPPQNAEPSQ